MKKLLAAALAGVAMIAAPAQAQDNNGKVQVKVLGTYVAPDGEITDLRTDIVGLPAGTRPAGLHLPSPPSSTLPAVALAPDPADLSNPNSCFPRP